MIIQNNFTDSQLLEQIHHSAVEYSYLLNKEFLIVGKSKKKSPAYLWFICSFRENQFMHLLGIDSKTMSAKEFFLKALNYNSAMPSIENLSINDCTPSRDHSRKNINEKSSCAPELFQLNKAKYFCVGPSDKQRKYVDLSYVYGKEAILGFSNENRNFNFPRTIITDDIDNCTTARYKTMYVFFRDKYSKAPFHDTIYEIKANILKSIHSTFPLELQSLIIP